MQTNDNIIDLSERIKLNVGGRIFETTYGTLQKYPHLPLLQIIQSGVKDNDGCYFLDRNPEAFAAILDFYRCDRIRPPPNLHFDIVQREFEYWGLVCQKPIQPKTVNSYFNLTAYHLQPLENESHEDIFVSQVYLSIYPAITNKWRYVVVPLDPPLSQTICHGLICFYFNFISIEFRQVVIDQKQCNINGEIHTLISTSLTMEDREARVAICKLF